MSEVVGRKVVSGEKASKEEEKPPSIIKVIFEDVFVKSSLWTAFFSLNTLLGYFCLLLAVADYSISANFIFLYPFLLYCIHVLRKSRKEKCRQETARHIPFFTDALANALSVGSTMEKALKQACYYLKGEIKEDFEKLILKSALGKDIGVLLRNIDSKFPNTGLRYLISLLAQYRELGVGISPLLKGIATSLTIRNEAEAKIDAILSAGSSYARMAMGIFFILFLGMLYFFKDQMVLLLIPKLKPVFFFLIAWIVVGVLVVMRITSMEFCRSFSIRPQISHYLKERKLSITEVMKYSGIHWSKPMEILFLYSPAIAGFCFAYFSSWYVTGGIGIALAFVCGAIIFWGISRWFLAGLFEDELIKIIEAFPDLLQVFIIGLNSGLNTYKAFEFAELAVRKDVPKLFSEELCRTKFAMQCGENHTTTWEKFGKHLPFETIVDFSEIMVVSPMHGESIVSSIVQMAKNYESKKLLMIEKNAVIIGQMVIPVIVIAFLPLFLFVMFAPIIIKITGIFH